MGLVFRHFSLVDLAEDLETLVIIFLGVSTDIMGIIMAMTGPVTPVTITPKATTQTATDLRRIKAHTPTLPKVKQIITFKMDTSLIARVAIMDKTPIHQMIKVPVTRAVVVLVLILLARTVSQKISQRLLDIVL